MIDITIKNFIRYCNTDCFACNTDCFSRYASEKKKENESETTEIFQLNVLVARFVAEDLRFWSSLTPLHGVRMLAMYIYTCHTFFLVLVLVVFTSAFVSRVFHAADDEKRRRRKM